MPPGTGTVAITAGEPWRDESDELFDSSPTADGTSDLYPGRTAFDPRPWRRQVRTTPWRGRSRPRSTENGSTLDVVEMVVWF